VFVYTAKTQNASVRSRRGLSWRDASTDRLGRSIGAIEYGGVAALRRPLSVAVPTFYGHRVDVSRGLRPRRLLHIAERVRQSCHCDSADHVAAIRFGSDQLRAISGAARDHLLLGGTAAWSRLPLLWFGIRASAVEGSGTPAARSFDRLSSTLVRAESCFPIAGTSTNTGCLGIHVTRH